MSFSDENASVVQQKKEDNDSVNWREYVALRDHLTHQLGEASEKVQTGLAATDAKVDSLQQSMTALQQTMEVMTRSMQTITQRHGQPADGASVQAEHEDQFGAYDDADEEVDGRAHAGHVGRGEGRGAASLGRGLAPLGRARVLNLQPIVMMMDWESQNSAFPNLRALLMWKNILIGS